MAAPRHLHFDRTQMNKTMPKAIAFEPEESFEGFIHDFLLEPNPVDVKQVRQSLAALGLAIRMTAAAAISAPFERVRMIAHHRRKEKMARNIGRNSLHQTIGRDIAKYVAAVFGYSNDPLNRWVWPI